MIIGVALVVVVVVAVIVVAVADSTRRSDDGLTTVVAAAVVTAVVVVVVAAFALLGGLDPGGSGDPPAGAIPGPSPSVPDTGVAPLRDPDVVVAAAGEGRLPRPTPAVGGLADADVVVLGVAGLEPHSRATVHQCPAGATTPSTCRPGLAFNAGPHGAASVLVDVADDVRAVDGASTACAGEACSIVVFGSSRLEVNLVFGRRAPEPVTIEVDPRAVPSGGEVIAAASELPMGSLVSFAVCRPGGGGSADCGTSTVATRAAVSGRAAAPVTVSSGRCPRGARCAVAVIVDGGQPRAFAPVTILGGAGASYDDARVRAGVLGAGLLLAIAFLLLRRTDWTPVGDDPFAGVEVPADPFGTGADP